MPDFITADDLSTHLYAETISAITRQNPAITQSAIDEAISEAKGYLSRFDLSRLFNADSDDYFPDPALKSKVKSIIVWNIVRLANVNANLEIARANYEDAISWFKGIQKGIIDPEGWPRKPNDPNSDYPEGSTVSYSTQPKRQNHY